MAGKAQGIERLMAGSSASATTAFIAHTRGAKALNLTAAVGRPASSFEAEIGQSFGNGHTGITRQAGQCGTGRGDNLDHSWAQSPNEGNRIIKAVVWGCAGGEVDIISPMRWH